MTDLGSVAAGDQDAAARADANEGLAAMVATPGLMFDAGRVRFASTPWLERWRDETNRLVAAGEGIECVHRSGPGVWLAAAWRPGVFICTRPECGVAIAPSPREDNTCDECGVYYPGGTRPVIADVDLPGQGVFIVAAGVCAGCVTKLGARRATGA